MKSEIYDIEAKGEEGFWWNFDSVEGLENAKERAKSEREEYPHEEIRIKRRPNPPQVGQQVWYRPTQPDAFQGADAAYPAEVVGTVIETGLSKDMFTWILVKPDFGAPKWREEQINMRDFKARGVREYMKTPTSP